MKNLNSVLQLLPRRKNIALNPKPEVQNPLNPESHINTL